MRTEKSRPERIFAPAAVVRLRRPLRPTAQMRQHPPLMEQWITIKQYAAKHGIALGPSHILRRVQGRRYTFAKDADLHRALSRARKAAHVLLMDDVFRLIDGMQAEAATEFMRELHATRIPIFSIRHGRLLTKLPMDTIGANLTAHVARFRNRSEAIRAGLPDNIAPARQAVLAGARARQRMADSTAHRLHQEIENVRAELLEAERDNRSAIARALNAAGITGPGGGAWQGTTVKRVEERIAKLATDE